MTSWEWCLVVLVNGAIIGFGLWYGRKTRRTVDWFLAAKGLPWWIVGLSMFATAVDSGDYVAVAGEAYRGGMIYISSWWLGMTFGWLLLAYVVILPMYRLGMYTNSEYLEYRFGPATRLISVFIQIQYRTNVLANVSYSLYLMFHVLTGWDSEAWWLVVGIAALAAAYTATGGLKSVAVTDAMQSVVMFAASVTFWWIVYNAVGGWSRLESRLAEIDPDLADTMLHVGGGGEQVAPAALIVIGYMIVLTAYCVVNQSQAMRMLGSRSKWDVKMAAVLAAAVTAVAMWFNVTLGILGRAEFPELASFDKIFPQLVEKFLVEAKSGLAGIVVAGLLAGGLSTYDSIGSALSAVFTRDFYARFIVRNADDRHYLGVSRIVTVAAIAISFAYIPFLKDGMVAFYMELTGVAVIPLLAVYLMGVLTPVSRRSGSVGLIGGILYGLSRFANPLLEWLSLWTLPVWWTDKWWGYIWSILITASVMVLTSLCLGWAKKKELAGLTCWGAGRPESDPLPPVGGAASWLEISKAAVPPMAEHPFPTAGVLPVYKRPLVWAGLLFVVIGYLNLVLFW